MGAKNSSPVEVDVSVEEPVVDPTAWMIENPIAETFLLHDFPVKFMFLLGYTFYTGIKIFKSYGDKPASYKFTAMAMACTGGGLIVPIFLNGMPIFISNDAYPIAIGTSFALLHYFPVLLDVYAHSDILKAVVTVMYEVTRAYVVVLFTSSSAKAISASLFSYPIFGPIVCGAISGVGGAFMPFSKGLDPIKDGLDYKMLTAVIGATCYHIFISTSLSDGCIEAKEKAHIHMTLFFVSTALFQTFGFVLKKKKD